MFKSDSLSSRRRLFKVWLSLFAFFFFSNCPSPPKPSQICQLHHRSQDFSNQAELYPSKTFKGGGGMEPVSNMNNMHVPFLICYPSPDGRQQPDVTGSKTRHFNQKQTFRCLFFPLVVQNQQTYPLKFRPNWVDLDLCWDNGRLG